MKPFHCLRCGTSITSPYGYCDVCCRKKGDRIRQYLPSISKEQRFTRDGRPICILCGRVCEVLKTHLTKVHNIDINDYRKKYKGFVSLFQGITAKNIARHTVNK